MASKLNSTGQKVSSFVKRNKKRIAIVAAGVSAGILLGAGIAIHRKNKSDKEKKLEDELNEFLEKELQMELIQPVQSVVPPNTDIPKIIVTSPPRKETEKQKQESRSIIKELEYEFLGIPVNKTPKIIKEPSVTRLHRKDTLKLGQDARKHREFRYNLKNLIKEKKQKLVKEKDVKIPWSKKKM